MTSHRQSTPQRVATTTTVDTRVGKPPEDAQCEAGKERKCESTPTVRWTPTVSRLYKPFFLSQIIYNCTNLPCHKSDTICALWCTYFAVAPKHEGYLVSLLLMEEILHQLIGSLSHYLQVFFTSQVVQDFFHQQYDLTIIPSSLPLLAEPTIWHCRLRTFWWPCCWELKQEVMVKQRMRFLPLRELTYPTVGKGKSSSKKPLGGDMWSFLGRYSWVHSMMCWNFLG